MSPADADRWRELKRRVVQMKEGLDLALTELVSGAPANEEKVRKALNHVHFGLTWRRAAFRREGLKMRYDASKKPDPAEWLDLDESERLDSVISYHKRAKLPVGENNRLHAAAHVIVENQLAMGDATVVPATLARLMREGLDRHDAIHAIGSVLLQIVFDVSTGTEHPDINAAYGRQLAELTAAGWRSQA